LAARTIALGRTGGAPAAAGLSIADRLDRLDLTHLHVAILALCVFGLAADIGEVALSNTFSAIFLAPPYNATRSDVSWLLAAVFAGGAVGAPAFGYWADRHGRRAALQAALVLLAASSLAVAFSPNLAWMTAFRFVSGLALGGYPPLTAAYLADVLPPMRRGLLMLLTGALAFLGAPAMIFLIRWLAPIAPVGIEGWRWALICGAGVSAATAALFFRVPESPRWLAALGRGDEAERSYRKFELAAKRTSSLQSQEAYDFGRTPNQSPATHTETTQNHVGRTFLLGALYALGPWATIGFPLLSAAIMVQKGFRVGDSLLFAGLSMFGPTLGIGIAAFFIDRLERRLALILCAVAMTVIGLLFAGSQSLTPLVLLGFAFNLASALYSVVLSVYGAELFPTQLRALATSAGWSAGRVVSALVPLVLLPLLGSQGPLAMFVLIAAVLLASVVLIVVAGPPGLAKRPVE
jgi:MFS transporter, putative metabolite:H+ symporter